jgi:VanZ family protein
VSENAHNYISGAPWARRTIYWRFLLVLVYAGTIFMLSSIPGKDLPSIRVSDKLLHTVEFGGFALLLYRALRVLAPTQSRHFIALISVVITVCYGVVDEAHQLLVAQRVADLADLAADGLGAGLAVWGWSTAEYHWPWLQ